MNILIQSITVYTRAFVIKNTHSKSALQLNIYTVFQCFRAATENYKFYLHLNWNTINLHASAVVLNDTLKQ